MSSTAGTCDLATKLVCKSAAVRRIKQAAGIGQTAGLVLGGAAAGGLMGGGSELLGKRNKKDKDVSGNALQGAVAGGAAGLGGDALMRLTEQFRSGKSEGGLAPLSLPDSVRDKLPELVADVDNNGSVFSAPLTTAISGLHSYGKEHPILGTIAALDATSHIGGGIGNLARKRMDIPSMKSQDLLNGLKSMMGTAAEGMDNDKAKLMGRFHDALVNDKGPTVGNILRHARAAAASETEPGAFDSKVIWRIPRPAKDGKPVKGWLNLTLGDIRTATNRRLNLNPATWFQPFAYDDATDAGNWLTGAYRGFRDDLRTALENKQRGLASIFGEPSSANPGKFQLFGSSGEAELPAKSYNSLNPVWTGTQHTRPGFRDPVTIKNPDGGKPLFHDPGDTTFRVGGKLKNVYEQAMQAASEAVTSAEEKLKDLKLDPTARADATATLKAQSYLRDKLMALTSSLDPNQLAASTTKFDTTNAPWYARISKMLSGIELPPRATSWTKGLGSRAALYGGVPIAQSLLSGLANKVTERGRFTDALRKAIEGAK